MRTRLALLALVGIGGSLSGCLLDRGGRAAGCTSHTDCPEGEFCSDGRCEPARLDAAPFDSGAVDSGALDGGTRDGGGPLDAGSEDGGQPPDGARDADIRDSGPPPHCSNGLFDVDIETDLDCGGECAGCGSCDACVVHGDCATGTCQVGRCQAALSDVRRADGSMAPAYQREDGAILLAYYAPAAYHTAYNPRTAQITSQTGGSTPGAGWAPDPCHESGHLALTDFDPSGRTIVMECGTGLDEIVASGSSAALFDDFSSSLFGSAGTGSTPATTPAWASLAAFDAGQGRARAGMCGISPNRNEVAGIAYCSGGETGWQTAVVNYTVARDPSGNVTPYIGCGANALCNGSGCITTGGRVWIWML